MPLLLMTLERVFDAAARGELRALGLRRARMLERLTDRFAEALS